MREALKERGFQKENISPIFDNNTCKQWGVAIYDEIQKMKKDGFRIADHSYGDDALLLPLQAADMITSVSRQRHFDKLESQVNAWHKSGHITNFVVTPNVFEVMLYRNLRPKIGFKPIVDETLGNEIIGLAQKFASVRRALSEVPNGYFKPWLNRRK